MLSQATYFISFGKNINSRASLIASPTILHALLPMTLKTTRLPLEAKPVAHDNNTIFMLKPGDQTFVAPYSTDNCSNIASSVEIWTDMQIKHWQ